MHLGARDSIDEKVDINVCTIIISFCENCVLWKD